MRTVSLHPYTGGEFLNHTIMEKSMYKSPMPYIGMPVKCKHPGWESKIGMICAINGDKITVEFGKRDFVEFYSDELITMTML